MTPSPRDAVECSCCAPAPPPVPRAEPPFDERADPREPPVPSLPAVLAARVSVLVW